MNTPLLALLGRHLTCLPCGVAALVVGQPYALGILLIEQPPLAVYLRCDDWLVRRTAALYARELLIGYLVDVSVDIEKLCHAELSVLAVAQYLLHGIACAFCAPTEGDYLLGEYRPKGYLSSLRGLVGSVHSGEVYRKAQDIGHHLLVGGGWQCAED